MKTFTHKLKQYKKKKKNIQALKSFCVYVKTINIYHWSLEMEVKMLGQNPRNIFVNT